MPVWSGGRRAEIDSPFLFFSGRIAGVYATPAVSLSFTSLARMSRALKEVCTLANGDQATDSWPPR